MAQWRTGKIVGFYVRRLVLDAILFMALDIIFSDYLYEVGANRIILKDYILLRY